MYNRSILAGNLVQNNCAWRFIRQLSAAEEIFKASLLHFVIGPLSSSHAALSTPWKNPLKEQNDISMQKISMLFCIGRLFPQNKATTRVDKLLSLRDKYISKNYSWKHTKWVKMAIPRQEELWNFLDVVINKCLPSRALLIAGPTSVLTTVEAFSLTFKNIGYIFLLL